MQTVICMGWDDGIATVARCGWRTDSPGSFCARCLIRTVSNNGRGVTRYEARGWKPRTDVVIVRRRQRPGQWWMCV